MNKKDELWDLWIEIREEFPYGHKDFITLALKEIALHSKKNRDFTKGSDPLSNFDRVSAIMRLYPNMDWASPVGNAISNKLKQLDVALWMISQGYEGEVEGVAERLRDDSIYDKLIMIMYRRQGENRP